MILIYYLDTFSNERRVFTSVGLSRKALFDPSERKTNFQYRKFGETTNNFFQTFKPIPTYQNPLLESKSKGVDNQTNDESRPNTTLSGIRKKLTIKDLNSY